MPYSGRTSKNFFREARVIHRALTLTPAGEAGAAVAEGYIELPPGRITHIKRTDVGTTAATTDVVVTVDGKSDGSTGTAVVTLDDDTASVAATAYGSTAGDEAFAATAATDAVEGGFFVKNGVHVDINDADPDQVIKVEFWVEILRYEVVELVAQSGADGAGAVTRTFNYNGAGNLLGIQIDYQNTPAGADLVIKADSSAGDTLLTRTSSQTDIGPLAVGGPGLDETGAASAATDGLAGGFVFSRGLYYSVAESDAFTSGNEKIVVHTWVRQ
jgi:predicted RecA/RadA family phage recombinase